LSAAEAAALMLLGLRTDLGDELARRSQSVVDALHNVAQSGEHGTRGG
jgi:hypothetical protein